MSQTSPSDDEQMLDLVNQIAAAKAQWREWIEMIDAEMLDLFSAREKTEIPTGNPGEKFYLGRDKKYRRRKDHKTIMDAIAVAILSGGEQYHKMQTTDLLASNAWKPGACLKMLGQEAFNELFEVIVIESVKIKKTRSEQ
jgi:hypothetical protein